MISCLDCKHTEDTIFEECKKCINEKSVYYGRIVDKRDLCREVEVKNEHKFNINN